MVHLAQKAIKVIVEKKVNKECRVWLATKVRLEYRDPQERTARRVIKVLKVFRALMEKVLGEIEVTIKLTKYIISGTTLPITVVFTSK